jgi:hypothetical protein
VPGGSSDREDPRQRDAADLNRRLSRVLAAMHNVARQVAARGAADAGARAAFIGAVATVDNLVAEVPRQTSAADRLGVWRALPVSGFGEALWRANGLGRSGSPWAGGVVFPELSSEGSRWVDAGTLHALFQDVFLHLGGGTASPTCPISVSIEVLTPSPRERELRLIASADLGEMPNHPFHGVLWDGEQVLATACGRIGQP